MSKEHWTDPKTLVIITKAVYIKLISNTFSGFLVDDDEIIYESESSYVSIRILGYRIKKNAGLKRQDAHKLYKYALKSVRLPKQDTLVCFISVDLIIKHAHVTPPGPHRPNSVSFRAGLESGIRTREAGALTRNAKGYNL